MMTTSQNTHKGGSPHIAIKLRKATTPKQKN